MNIDDEENIYVCEVLDSCLVRGSSIRARAQGRARFVIQPSFDLDPSCDASRFCCTSHRFTQVLVISGKSIVPGDQVFWRMSVLTKGQTSM
jgi:hypothetical protein